MLLVYHKLIRRKAYLFSFTFGQNLKIDTPNHIICNCVYLVFEDTKMYQIEKTNFTN